MKLNKKAQLNEWSDHSKALINRLEFQYSEKKSSKNISIYDNSLSNEYTYYNRCNIFTYTYNGFVQFFLIKKWIKMHVFIEADEQNRMKKKRKREGDDNVRYEINEMYCTFWILWSTAF